MYCEKGSATEGGELAPGVGGKRTSPQGMGDRKCEQAHGRFSHLDEQVPENQAETTLDYNLKCQPH